MSSPSFFSSISETARGFFGRFSPNLRARPSNALLHSSTSSLPLVPPAPSLLSRFSKSSVSLSTECAGSTLPVELGDDDAEKALGAPPGKTRFEGSGFSFHFKNRNSSTSSLLQSAGVGLKTSPYKQPQHQQQPQQPPQQQPQCHEQQQVSEAKLQRRYLQLPIQPSRDRDDRKGVRHSSVLSTGVAHGSSSGKLIPTKQRPVFKRHHTDTPCASTKKEEVPAALQSISEVNVGNDNHATRITIPKTVTIRHLPAECIPPDASFGHNAKRNEKYARTRLAALRDHQLALVKLLSDLVETENRFREQHQHVEPPVAAASGHSGDPPRSKAQEDLRNMNTLNARPIVCRHHKREVAAHEYQKALLDLWQADNSLCHWLIRYIRTARRVSRNLDLMLLDSSAACAFGSPVSLDKNKNHTTWYSTRVRLSSGSTFDLVSTTLPHVDEIARPKGPSATTLGRADNQTLKTRPNPVLTRSRRVSHLSASPKSSQSPLLRMPFQAPTSPPPPVPAPQPPRDFMNSASNSTSAGARFTQQLVVVQVHPVPSHRRDRFQDGLSPLPPRCKSSIAGGGDDDFIMEQRRFQDFDELEAAVFVGRHMQSLQKANEFLYRFDREASHSKITLDRFENAREVYKRWVNRG